MRYLSFLVFMLVAWTSLPASAYEKPPFPRLGVYWISNQNYQDPAVRKELARSDVVIINTWDGWESSAGVTLESVIQDIKAQNPRALVFNYVLNESIPLSHYGAREFIKKADEMKWWLYPVGASGTPTTSFFGGDFVTVNNTLNSPPDANGDRWVEWFAKWNYRKLAVPNPSLEGFYLDNVFPRPRINGDWNRDGVTDSKSDSTVGLWQRQGLARHFDVMRQLMPGRFQIGNIAEWGHPDATLTELSGKLDGGLIEGIIGMDWSVESWGTWQQMMDWYRKTMDAVAEPKLVVFHQI